MRKSAPSIAIGLALLASLDARAQREMNYVGGGIGTSHIGVDCSGLAQCDKSSSGGKLFFGHRVTRQWAAELVYLNWGRATARSTEVTARAATGQSAALAAAGDPVTVDGELNARGLGAGAAYFLPFSADWNGVFRLGVVGNVGKFTGTGSAAAGAVTRSASKQKAFTYFGLGLGYRLTPRLGLTGEADFSRVKYGLDGEYQSNSVRLISIGLCYLF